MMAQVYAGYMVLWGWINNTFAGEPAKRAVAVALINGLGNTGNIIGSLVTLISLSLLSHTPRRYVWQSSWGPTYRYSYIVCLAMLGLSTSMFGAMYLYLKHLNEQMERKERGPKGDEGHENSIRFRYLL
jgi:hypothetical protein